MESMGGETIAKQPDAKQPDIDYKPDFKKYKARAEARWQNESLEGASLPPGFPQRLKSKLVWQGKALSAEYDWTHVLSEQDVDELESALTHFKSLGKSLGHINQETFPLPKLHNTLREISRELHFGHGFKVVRGLPIAHHSRRDNIILYAGISSHIAPLRGRQDSQYDGKPASVVLAHIKDLTFSSEKEHIGAPAYTNDKQVYHTDAGDIVSLLALSTAAEGGTSRLASTWRVYNELAATRPDLIATLSEDWTAETYGNHSRAIHKKPLLFHQPSTSKSIERIVLQYARAVFTGFGALPRSKDMPPITEAQAEALDALHFLGERFNVGLDFRQGDIQYLNNLAVFHARDEFTDSAEQQRHLVRLWLRDPEYAWPTPEPLKPRWAQLYEGVDEESQVFALEPYVRSPANGKKNSKLNSG